MNLTQFRAHIKAVDHATLDAYFAELSGKLARATSPARRRGYALALDELVIESNFRKAGPVDPELANLTPDELERELQP